MFQVSPQLRLQNLLMAGLGALKRFRENARLAPQIMRGALVWGRIVTIEVGQRRLGILTAVRAAQSATSLLQPVWR